MKKQTLQDLLEAQIDANGLASVLQAISDVCYEKANHVESNWQDANLAHRWDKVAALIGRCAGSESVSTL